MITKEKIQKLHTWEVIELLRNKGGCIHTTNLVSVILVELKGRVLANEFWDLYLAAQHAELGEGRSELDDVCNRLIDLYKKNFRLR
ncbi:MAG TPA: hypothetical protein VEA37_12185 [Flavobacterium sp.]|nr:hypothetical protein [Flavobacterium sp.]